MMMNITNVDGSFLLVTSENPNLDVGISKGSNAFWDTLKTKVQNKIKTRTPFS